MPANLPADELRAIERKVAERHGYSRPWAAPHLLGTCPGGAEYGHGMTLTTVHVRGCCQRWDELIAQAVREQLSEVAGA